jgi:large subunit ribosomal protein L11
MAKKVKVKFKVLARGGQANPGPPLGPTLGQHGVNINEFTTRFNEETKDRMGDLVPTIVTLYEDKSFDLLYKTAPASELIKTELKLQKGSDNPLANKIGKITQAQLQKIAEIKMPDLNANDIEAAKKIIAGTAKQMGLTIED